MRHSLAVGVLGAEVVLLRIDHVVLGPRDAAEDSTRGQLLGIEPHAPHHLLDDAGLVVLVVDGKLRVRPSLPTLSVSMSRRSMRTHSEWNVEISGLESDECPISRFTRSPISAAALLVNVTARIA